MKFIKKLMGLQRLLASDVPMAAPTPFVGSKFGVYWHFASF